MGFDAEKKLAYLKWSWISTNRRWPLILLVDMTTIPSWVLKNYITYQVCSYLKGSIGHDLLTEYTNGINIGEVAVDKVALHDMR